MSVNKTEDNNAKSMSMIGMFNDLMNAQIMKRWVEKSNTSIETRFIIVNDKGDFVE